MIKLLKAAALAAGLCMLALFAFVSPAGAVTFNKFNLFVDDLSKGALNLSTDTIKAMLTNTAPVATNHCYADISANELASGNGYTTGGATVSGTSLANSSGTETLNASYTTWTSTTGNMGPFRYVVYYDSTPSSCKTLIGWYDNGSSITLNGVNGDTFTVTPTGGALFTLAANDLPPLVQVAALWPHRKAA